MVMKCGLEVHGYIQTESNRKLFCDCVVSHDSEPNTNVCPVCTGQPGSKPMSPNREAMEKAVTISLMSGCKVNRDTFFLRKHYDWPDMPTGFQKTGSGSYSFPVGVGGEFLGVRITQVHIEEDPARWDPKSGLIDYNRSGVPLIEIVTEPDFSDAEDVQVWLKKLITTLKYVKSLDIGGGIKSDVNVSIEPDFERVEIKNVNSLTGIFNAIKYEVKRQGKVKAEGGSEVQHTRRWNDQKQKTEFMRSKEEAQDYRFIREPDLLSNHFDNDLISGDEEILPEKPYEKLERYKGFGVPVVDAEILSSDIYVADIFESVIKSVDVGLATKWIRGQLLSVMNYNGVESQDLNINVGELVVLLKKLESNEITDEVGRKVLRLLFEDEKLGVEKYVKDNNLLMVSDLGEIEGFCRRVIEENPVAVEDFKSGSEKSLNFLVGNVMRLTKGKSNPQETAKVLKRLIG